MSGRRFSSATESAHMLLEKRRWPHLSMEGGWEQAAWSKMLPDDSWVLTSIGVWHHPTAHRYAGTQLPVSVGFLLCTDASPISQVPVLWVSLMEKKKGGWIARYNEVTAVHFLKQLGVGDFYSDRC